MRNLLATGVTLTCTGLALAQAQPDPRTLAEVEQDVLASFDFDGEFDAVGPKSADAGRDPDLGDDDSGPGLTLRGGPANDACVNATVIPTGVVTYNPPLLNTTGALITICEAFEDCESGNVGVSNSVWYRYTADADGSIEVNTFGSNYNTVLSIWDGCGSGFLPPCTYVPNQLACNDNASFGTQSQVFLDVVAGETYLIKVSDYNTSSGGGLLDFDLRYFPPNDACANPTEIPGGPAWDPPLLATHNAQPDLCEASESCEFNNVGVSNSVWYAFTPPCDGSVSINTNGSTYDTVLSIFDGCGEFVAVDAPCNLPGQIACDDDAGTGTNSQLFDVPVVGGQKYLIKVADYNTTQGGGYLDFNFFFSGATPPTIAITAPTALDCACDIVEVFGTAATPDDAPIEWTVDVRPAAGGAWTVVNNSTTEVNAGLLAVWNTAGYGEGPYLIRLTATNGCGIADTAIQLVHLDKQFDSLSLDAPANGAIVGGLVCLDGTAYDNACFDSYTTDWRPLGGGGSWQPVDPANPAWFGAVINNPLGQWDTLAAGVPDGGYELNLTGVTDCGSTASETIRIEVDNTPPVAIIDSPVDCQLIDGVIQIVGTADDANLTGWTLQVTGGPYTGWVTLAGGTTPVISGVLATWDTTGLPPCAYTFRLLATDAAVLNCNGAIHHQTEALVSILVDASPCPGDVDNDGDVDISDLALLLANFGIGCF